MSEQQQQQNAGRTPAASGSGERPDGAWDGRAQPSPEPESRPQPGFEPGPSAAVDSNYEHPAPAGARTSPPGVGITADVECLAPPAQAAELVRDLSQPGEGSEVSSARYH